MTDILKRNNVNVIGDGKKVMIFAHGFGCDQNVWSYLVKEFSSDYKLVLFDYVGAGKSDISAYDSQKYSKLEGYAQDILDVCEALKIKDAIFIGHSVSSIIGLLAANKEPSYFEKLVFIGPSPRYMNDEGYTGGFERENLEQLFDMMDSNYLGWSRSLAPAIMGNPDRPELGDELTNNFCATDPKIAGEFARVTFLSDNRSDLSKLQIPSLTLQCADDIIAPVEVGYYMEKNTPGNLLVMMKATGHCPHMSAPEETVKAIKAFIS
jgi:sigma-B regulation protein RsbQ